MSNEVFIRNKPSLGSALLLSFLVQASPGLGPHQLGRLLSLVHHVSALGRREGDGLKRQN
jgi:hypothetical protein